MQGAYPEMEVLWLLTKTWNCGIHQYRLGRALDCHARDPTLHPGGGVPGVCLCVCVHALQCPAVQGG